jgi:hypothetical protein
MGTSAAAREATRGSRRLPGDFLSGLRRGFAWRTRARLLACPILCSISAATIMSGDDQPRAAGEPSGHHQQIRLPQAPDMWGPDVLTRKERQVVAGMAVRFTVIANTVANGSGIYPFTFCMTDVHTVDNGRREIHEPINSKERAEMERLIRAAGWELEGHDTLDGACVRIWPRANKAEGSAPIA